MKRKILLGVSIFLWIIAGIFMFLGALEKNTRYIMIGSVFSLIFCISNVVRKVIIWNEEE